MKINFRQLLSNPIERVDHRRRASQFDVAKSRFHFQQRQQQQRRHFKRRQQWQQRHIVEHHSLQNVDKVRDDNDAFKWSKRHNDESRFWSNVGWRNDATSDSNVAHFLPTGKYFNLSQNPFSISFCNWIENQFSLNL